MKNLHKTIEGKLRSGYRFIGVLDRWGYHSGKLGPALCKTFKGRSVIGVDVWEVDAVGSVSHSLLAFLVERIVPARSGTKIWSALAYIAAGIATRVSGVDFGLVQGGLAFADTQAKFNPLKAHDEVRELLVEVKESKVVVFYNMSRLQPEQLRELALTTRFLRRNCRLLSFVCLLDSGEVSGVEEILGEVDCLVHVPTTRSHNFAEKLLNSWKKGRRLSGDEREALENFLTKVMGLPGLSHRSTFLAAEHFMSSKTIARRLGLLKLAPFLLVLKYQSPVFYDAILNGGNSPGLDAGVLEKKIMELVLAEDRAVNANGVANNSSVNRVHQLVAALERRNV